MSFTALHSGNPYVSGDPLGYQSAELVRTNFNDHETRVLALETNKILKTTLTAAQVKALNTTPITLVAAGGSGTVILVRRITFASTFVSVAYTGANALEFRYTDASGAKVTADIANTTLNFASGTRYATVAGVTTELQPVANSPIVVRVPTANPGAGDSPVAFEVEYTLRTLP